MTAIEINKKYYEDNVIFDITNDINKSNKTSCNDFTRGLYIYNDKIVENIHFSEYDNKKTIVIEVKNKKSEVNCFGISLKLKNNIKSITNAKICFSGRILSNHKNVYFRIFTGNKWIKIEKQITDQFQYFELKEEFKFYDMENNFTRSPQKYRIGIIDTDEYDEYDDKTINYIIELSKIELIETHNHFIEKIENENNIFLKIYLLDVISQNVCSFIFNTFMCYLSDNNSKLKPLQLSLIEINESNMNDVNTNDILLCGDFYIKHNNPELIKGYNKIVNTYFKLFKKENIIWYNFESPYVHTRWLEKEYVDNFGLIFGTFLDLNGNLNDNNNRYWIPAKSDSIAYYKYNKYNFIETEINKKKNLIVANPYRHQGSLDNNSYNKFGNRNDIIKNLIDNSLDVHIYGILILKPKEQYASNYHGEAGERYSCDFATSKIKVLSNYKFIIACENFFIDGYLTEKLNDCLFTLNVPIYFGYPNIEKILPNLFNNGVINGFKFNTLQDLIKFIKNMSDEEYNERINNIKREREVLFKIISQQNQFSYMITTFLKLKKYNVNYDNHSSILDNINKLYHSD